QMTSPAYGFTKMEPEFPLNHLRGPYSRAVPIFHFEMYPWSHRGVIFITAIGSEPQYFASRTGLANTK
ncbi:MAG: hypothetical protein WA658_02525, partial [Candidatus Acidiferrales bacterium]